MTSTRSRSLLAALATFSAILLLHPAQAKPPAKPATPPGPLPACLLTLEVRQVHWTLDPLEHAKDHINALQFDLPADLRPVERARGGQAHQRRTRGHDGARAAGQHSATADGAISCDAGSGSQRTGHASPPVHRAL